MSKIITAIEPQKNNKNRYSVFTDGEYAFSLDDETLVKSRLKTGAVVTDEDIRYLTDEASFVCCKEFGMRLLSRKRYTRCELVKKMIEKGFSNADVVCERLSELGFINDEDFARAYICDAAKISGKGARLIRAELKHKGIDEDVITASLEGFENSDSLNRLVEKKFKGKTPDRKAAASVFAACMRKGYNADEIRSAIRKYTDEEFADE